MLCVLCEHLVPPRVCLELQVVVQTSKSVRVKSIHHTLVIAVTVLLQVVQQVSMTAVLENQVNGTCTVKLWLVGTAPQCCLWVDPFLFFSDDAISRISSIKHTCFSACTEEVHNVDMVTNVSHHLQFRHQCLLLHRLVFLCGGNRRLATETTSNRTTLTEKMPTFQHLDSHLMWDSGFADTISCGMDHHAESSRPQLVSCERSTRSFCNCLDFKEHQISRIGLRVTEKI